MKKITLLVSSFIAIFTAANACGEPDKVMRAPSPVVVDGKASDKAWDTAQWRNIDKHILGEMPSPEDFSGRYKLLWDEGHLYLLAQIKDDVLYDVHPDPLLSYWDDDCLEIFIDEDASGGEHQFNYNAFAYHVALDNQSVDIGKKLKDGSPEFLLLNDHVESRWMRQAEAPHDVIWEVAVKIFDDAFDPAKTNTPVALKKGKSMGFMLAYCDNDGSEEREHFIGSHVIEPRGGDKNLGYKDASVFGRITLAETP